jgi:hypothetical protein
MTESEKTGRGILALYSIYFIKMHDHTGGGGDRLTMTGSDRRKTLIFLSLVILMTILVAAGLPRLVFQPGLPLPSLNRGQFVAVPGENQPAVSISINLFFEVLFGLLLAASFLYMIYRLIMGVVWSDYRSLILKTAGTLIGIAIIFIIIMMILSSVPVSAPAVVPLPPPPEPAARTPLGDAPSFLFWVIGFVLLMLVSWVGVWAIESFSKKTKPIDLLILEAEKARQALLTGENIKNVIVRCYQQMSLALKLEQGVEREEFMTPREFEQKLEAMGIPFEPIHKLTQLFEAVRYGNWQPRPGDEQNAIECLDAIVLSSRALKRDH